LTRPWVVPQFFSAELHRKKPQLKKRKSKLTRSCILRIYALYALPRLCVYLSVCLSLCVCSVICPVSFLDRFLSAAYFSERLLGPAEVTSRKILNTIYDLMEKI